MGQMSEMVSKGKRKESYASSSTTALLEIQEKLKSACRKIAEQDADNARRDEEHRQSQSRISEMEKLIAFMKNIYPRLAAFMSQSLVLDSSPGITPITVPATIQPSATGSTLPPNPIFHSF
ncbi:unnamed protein product [Arabis nemorensis]|uniref:Uncharacterized protein n=1 Tax=Arabis nemorensis TaxID=586526 RepID=A0A565BBE3_9BRAS|nr:unnamed protein product [Arabis nemorensis]